MNFERTTTAQPLNLGMGWTVRHDSRDVAVPIDFPGDVHSALLDAGQITDPYWRDTETSLDWVHESEWVAEKRFQLDASPSGRHVLSLDGVDCLAVVTLNGQEIGHCENRFLRYDFDVGDALVAGENTLSVRFLSSSRIARQRAAESSIPTPHLHFNNRLPHYNYLRKTQCHAGWDWNIALAPIGIYGSVVLRPIDDVRLDDVAVNQTHENDRVHVEITAVFDSDHAGTIELGATIDGKLESRSVDIWPGSNRASVSLTIDNPRLWWPADHGPQELYDLIVTVGSEKRRLRIGLRTVDLITDSDEVGERFAFRINGREIFMRGANWIPADALPARETPERVRDLLLSARDANMNMLRVWGGGQYEPDWFYEMCSESGILVWQDFMFSCNLYPAHDRGWLDSVRVEARQQLRRLSTHPCIALLCGDNELVGALGWFDESKANRDRYLAIYDRLNHALEEAVEDEAIDVPFWPSSPTSGRLSFGDGWHNDRAGDMHFWDVWHEAKDFEHYRTVRPRFCSEFGFQSFPSLRSIESFTVPADRNVSSAVMEVHQRNDGGNSRIVETLARYFRFPDGFEDMAFLSQVSQGLAMKTAIEFWRANKPRCMGTLYWQLNDTWPVASWSGLEYGGGWKLVHYLARRFFSPVLISAQPDDETGDIVLWATNDTPSSVSLSVGLRSVHPMGAMATLGSYAVVCPEDRAVEVTRLTRSDIPDGAFIHFSWIDADGRFAGDNEYLIERPKAYALQQPTISVAEATDGDSKILTFETDVPALFVTYDHGGDTVYSDNCFTLLPGMPKQLTILRERSSHLPATNPDIQFLKG